MIAAQAHRAVVALLRGGLGLSPGPGEVADIAATDPHRIMEIAGAHRLLQALAPGLEAGAPLARALPPAALPEDAVLFLREMRAGNGRRNARLAAALGRAGRALAADGLGAVALKGGAELALEAGGDAPAPARFAGDLDLLVEEARAEAAQRLLIGAGWREGGMPEIERARHHHLPPLVHPDHPGMIELHRRVGHAPVAAALPAAEVIARSRATALLGIRVPDPADRLAHLALHAQFGNPGWAERRLRLCDAADIARAVRAHGPPALEAARARCAAAGRGDAFDGLVGAAHLLIPELVPAPPPARRSDAWARAAVARLGRTGALRRAYLVRRARERLGELLHDPERRAHWRRQLTEPGAARRAWAALRTSLQRIS